MVFLRSFSGVAMKTFLPLCAVLLFTLASSGQDGKKDRGKEDLLEQGVVYRMDYLDKTYGLKCKAVKVANTGVGTPMSIKLTLEFTKDAPNLDEVRKVFAPYVKANIPSAVLEELAQRDPMMAQLNKELALLDRQILETLDIAKKGEKEPRVQRLREQAKKTQEAISKRRQELVETARLSIPKDSATPVLLWFYSFDKENVSLGKTYIKNLEGEITGKEGDAFRVLIEIPQKQFVETKKVEARPAEKK
jgi:hypothetical protein